MSSCHPLHALSVGNSIRQILPNTQVSQGLDLCQRIQKPRAPLTQERSSLRSPAPAPPRSAPTSPPQPVARACGRCQTSSCRSHKLPAPQLPTTQTPQRSTQSTNSQQTPLFTQYFLAIRLQNCPLASSTPSLLLQIRLELQ